MIVLNVIGLVAALVIAVSAGMLIAVVTHKKYLKQIVAYLVVIPAIFALPIWTTSLAWTHAGGIAVWLVPVVYLVLFIPVAFVLFSAASAGAQP